MRETIVRQAKALDIPGQAVIATDTSGTILFWNAGAELFYGWRAAEVLGRNILDVTANDMSRREATVLMEKLREGRSWSGKFSVQHKNGSWVRAHVMDTPVLDASGEVVGVIGISARADDPDAVLQG